MTSAALQAVALGSCLDRSGAVDRAFARRDFRAASRVVAAPLSVAVGGDFMYDGTTGSDYGRAETTLTTAGLPERRNERRRVGAPVRGEAPVFMTFRGRSPASPGALEPRRCPPGP